MNPRTAAPFFSLAALAFLAACVSRFPEIHETLDDPLHAWIAFTCGALLVVAGYFEGQLVYEASPVSLPRWMLISSRPVKWAFTFGLIYLSLVAIAVWDFKLSGINPVAPDAWPIKPRVFFFIMMTLGMSFIYYLHASKVLIPLMRAIAWPARVLPRPIGLPLALVMGAALGLLFVHWVEQTAVTDTAGAVDRLLSAPLNVALGTLSGLAGLTVLGAACLRRSG